MPRRPRQSSNEDRETQLTNGPRREEVFARLVREHAQFLYRVAHSLLRHPQDAEDAVQDALLKLYRGESWRAMQDERAFLARVVWRAALDRLHARHGGASVEGEQLQLLDARPTPDIVAEQADDRALLRELIEALPEKLREPLLLSAIEEMSSPRIGEVMDLPEGTVRTRLMRARSLLKAKFEERRTNPLTASR